MWNVSNHKRFGAEYAELAHAEWGWLARVWEGDTVQITPPSDAPSVDTDCSWFLNWEQVEQLKELLHRLDEVYLRRGEKTDG